ncbi:MAG TPA: HNH endonuclease signature motif containing protein [Methanospirillum sp.]|uniref:HNH endonuclease signature motif containing protein n=1 Tax=Methanospirillum sp. TaxID=45200 RepID=UPI002BB43A02|nr:HNH endonuclease signature motif containing protein [Methanospirillum sp.]HOJ95232.1 HNH endonuclease signature motif containing protein [Methanospirillum sp.]HOL40961.1 HNH endonuclease signature motif containing protein [Methanospirillum sp.]HPP77482.1 HNH endonuclease signature motif containing protein [Methanospirillum sp.]
MKSLHWRDYIPCFNLVARNIRDGELVGRCIQDAVMACTADDPRSKHRVLGVPSGSVAFLEYLFHQAGGPYSPDFEWIAAVIQTVFSSDPDLRHLIDLNASDALANMVLNKRGRLKFLISDQVELCSILEWWIRFGLLPVTPRQVFDAILNKPTIRDRILKGDPLLILRLLDVFPEYADEVNPGGYSRTSLITAAGTITKPPSERRYHHLYTRARKAGRDVHSLIREEEHRILPMQMRRNRYLSYLVRKLHGNVCQICAARGEETRGPVEVHHIVPLSRDGKDLAENMITLCVYHHQAVHSGSIIVSREDGTIIIRGSEGTWKLPVYREWKA